MSVLQKVRLTNFRAFEDFTIFFGDSAFLVGPNNAGKTTILTVLRFTDIFLRYALSRKPSLRVTDRDLSLWAYPIALQDYPGLLESIHHEFRSSEARMEVTWRGGAKLVGVWPAEDDQEPYFYLLNKERLQPSSPVKVAKDFSLLGLVPVLSPVEHTEALLGESYVRQNMSTRLSSRHYRNQLYLMKQNNELDEFIEFASIWLNDIAIQGIKKYIADDKVLLDVYYTESGSRVPKELTWAGDGIQIWLQLLYHIFRIKKSDTLILDEPEVYLHADLQRRLVRLLESQHKQVILATHSPEVINEVNPKNIVIVDKNKKQTIRIKDDAMLNDLSTMIGSNFNLRLAQALRSPSVLFVEGNDMQILRHICKKLSLTNLANETKVTILPLNGFSRKDNVEPFAWLNSKVLTSALKLHIILDNDYRTADDREALEKQFSENSIHAHIWMRKEIENYLVCVTAIARLAKSDTTTIRNLVDSACDELESDSFSQMLNERFNHAPKGEARSTTISKFKNEFDKNWKNLDFKVSVVSGKTLIKVINRKLAELGLPHISTTALAASLLESEVPEEMASLLTNIEKSLSSS